MKHKLRKGSGFILVITAMVFVSLFSALMVSKLQQSVYENQALALNTKAFYLCSEASSATISALLTDSMDLLENGHFPKTDTLTHTNGTEVLGSSTIKLTREEHKYYGEDKEWIVASVETTIEDNRASAASGTYTYKTTFMLLVENPIVCIYNTDPNSLDN